MGKILVVDSNPEHGKVVVQYLIDMSDPHLTTPINVIAQADAILPQVFVLSIQSDNQLKSLVKEIRSHSEFFNSGIVCLTETESQFRELYEIGADVVLTLQSGLDDMYWAVFSLKRRLEGFEPHKQIEIGPYLLDPKTHSISYEGQSIKLKPTHFQLLLFFHKYPNRLLTRDWLKLYVWNGQKISERSIDAQISKLKKSLPELDSHIESIYGKGYIFHVREVKKTG